MSRLGTLIAIVFACFGAAATACDSLAPAANQWANCAKQVLPQSAEAEAVTLWEARNQGHIGNSNQVDRAGEKRWFASWRAVLVQRCGTLADASRKDAKYQEGHIPWNGLDEIDLIAFGD